MSETDPEPVENDADEAAGDAEEAPAFENRAARRARGKGKGTPPARGTGPQSHARGPFQGPRQWGNRRSG
jgi:hypothetical protein